MPDFMGISPTPFDVSMDLVFGTFESPTIFTGILLLLFLNDLLTINAGVFSLYATTGAYKALYMESSYIEYCSSFQLTNRSSSLCACTQAFCMHKKANTK